MSYDFYYEHGNSEIYVGKFTSDDPSLTVEDILDLLNFDEEAFKREHGLGVIDYDAFFRLFAY